jgi:hypothetical protein
MIQMRMRQQDVINPCHFIEGEIAHTGARINQQVMVE